MSISERASLIALTAFPPPHSPGWPAAPALSLFLCLSLRHAFEGALRGSDLRAPVALVRLRQLLPLHTVQLEYRFAFLGLAHPRLLRGGDLLSFSASRSRC